MVRFCLEVMGWLCWQLAVWLGKQEAKDAIQRLRSQEGGAE